MLKYTFYHILVGGYEWWNSCHDSKEKFIVLKKVIPILFENDNLDFIQMKIN